MFLAPEDRTLIFPKPALIRPRGLVVPDAPRLVAPGINFSANLGRKTAAGPPTSNISYIDSLNTTSTSVSAGTITNAIGDLILYVGIRGTLTLPSLPANFTSFDTNSVDAASDISCRVAYRYATAANEAIGSISSSTRSLISVWRGVHASSPIGDLQWASDAGNVTTLNVAGLTLVVTNGTSWVVVAINTSSTGTAVPTTPSGMTSMESSQASSYANRYAYQGPLASFGATTSTVSDNGSYLNVSLELKSS